MPSFQKLAVLAALALGATAASNCNDTMIDTLNYVFECDTVDGTVTISPSLQGAVQISGAKTFKKDFIVNNATNVLSITSSDLETIGGEFQVESCTLLNSISLPKLSTINNLNLLRCGQLNTIGFSSEGVQQASTVVISDTFLSDISGLNLATVESMNINNNNRLAKFNSNLQNITNTFIISSNAADMIVNLTQLETAYELQISNVKGFSVPALKEVESSIRFDTNPNLESFEAGNLTSVGSPKNGGSVSFINNAQLTNITFPVLKTISGDLTIVNNTKLDEITGFPVLTTVSNMLLGGTFENASLPKLNDVKGTITVKSTSNLTDVCKFFNGLSGNVVQGEVHCKGAVPSSEANNDSTSVNGTSGGGDNNKSAGAVSGLSSAALFIGLAAAALHLL